LNLGVIKSSIILINIAIQNNPTTLPIKAIIIKMNPVYFSNNKNKVKNTETKSTHNISQIKKETMAIFVFMSSFTFRRCWCCHQQLDDLPARLLLETIPTTAPTLADVAKSLPALTPSITPLPREMRPANCPPQTANYFFISSFIARKNSLACCDPMMYSRPSRSVRWMASLPAV